MLQRLRLWLTEVVGYIALCGGVRMVLTATITSSQNGLHGCQWESVHTRNSSITIDVVTCEWAFIEIQYWVTKIIKYRIRSRICSPWTDLQLHNPTCTLLLWSTDGRFIVKTLHPTSVRYISKVVHYITNLFLIFRESFTLAESDRRFSPYCCVKDWTDHETNDSNKESFTRTVNVTVLWAAPLILLTLCVNNAIGLHWTHFLMVQETVTLTIRVNGPEIRFRSL